MCPGLLVGCEEAGELTGNEHGLGRTFATYDNSEYTFFVRSYEGAKKCLQKCNCSACPNFVLQQGASSAEAQHTSAM